MHLLLGLYIGEVLLNIGLDIISEIRYKNLKKELGYINVGESEMSKMFSESPIITILTVVIYFMLPISIIISLKDNINFEHESLKALKRDIDHGVIRLKDEDEVEPLELVHKIKGARKSLVASYLNYLEELAKQQEQEKDPSVNNIFEADKSDYEEKKKELKNLQLQLDSAMRHNYKTK